MPFLMCISSLLKKSAWILVGFFGSVFTSAEPRMLDNSNGCPAFRIPFFQKKSALILFGFFGVVSLVRCNQFWRYA